MADKLVRQGVFKDVGEYKAARFKEKPEGETKRKASF